MLPNQNEMMRIPLIKSAALLFLLLAIAGMARAQTGTWTGKIAVQGLKLQLVFHLDGEHPTMDSPDQGAKGIPVQVERAEPGALTVRIPVANAEYRGQLTGNELVGTFTQHGVAFPLVLTPGEPALNRPQTPRPPYPYTQEEVSFANGDAVLKGTLTLPKSYTRATPVLLMITGSGLQNRDEELFEHKPFAVIADALARAGIATLRYDDRGFGASTGDAVNCTTEDLKNDALAGIQLLRERFDRVGVIGHSEGGTIALMLAAEQEADFIVSLAGMVVSGKETLLEQNRIALAAAGCPKEMVDTYCSLLSEAFDACIKGTSLPSADQVELPDALKQNYRAVCVQLQQPYLRYVLSLDMRPLLGKITCPVLAFNGTKDTQVFHELNLGALRDALPRKGANRVEAEAGLNHLFQHCTTGAVTEYREIEETFAPEVLEKMISWIAALFG